jgi:AcrR family transcriptional regulator
LRNNKLGNKSSSRKNQILRSAAVVFKEKGYQRATLQDIADRVGITKAALYHHFRSKDELLYTIVYSVMQRSVEALSRISEMPLSPEEKVRSAFHGHLGSHESSFPEHVVLVHENTDFLPLNKKIIIKNLFRDYIDLWEKIIIEGIENGNIKKDLDPKILVWAAIGMNNWVYKWASPKGRMKFKEIAEIFNNIFLEGIRIKNKRSNVPREKRPHS